MVIVKINLNPSALKKALFDGVAYCPKYYSGPPAYEGHSGFWEDTPKKALKVTMPKAIALSTDFLRKRYVESVEVIKVGG